jgi:hypothetical protein
MKKQPLTPTVSLKQTTPAQLGPGEYRPAGIVQRPEDLPPPKIIKENRDTPSQPCPQCGHAAARQRSYTRQIYDIGNLFSGRPCQRHVTYSQHYCSACRKYFNTDLSDLAAPRSLYTYRVQDLAVRLVVEDGLPYRAACWHLWRDHRVFVPFATIQNWVEAGGKKGQ